MLVLITVMLDMLDDGQAGMNASVVRLWWLELLNPAVVVKQIQIMLVEFPR